MIKIEEQLMLLNQLKECLEQEINSLKRGTPEEILRINHHKEKLVRELNQSPLSMLKKERVFEWLATQPLQDQQQFQKMLNLLSELQRLNQRVQTYSEAGLLYTENAINWLKKPVLLKTTYTSTGGVNEAVQSTSWLMNKTI